MVLVDYVNVDDIFGYLSRGKGRGREVRSLPLGFCVPIPLFQKSDTPSWGGERGGGRIPILQVSTNCIYNWEGADYLPSTFNSPWAGWVGRVS